MVAELRGEMTDVLRSDVVGTGPDAMADLAGRCPWLVTTARTAPRSRVIRTLQ